MRDKALKHTPYCRKTVSMFLRRYGYTVIWHNISYERQGSEKAEIQENHYHLTLRPLGKPAYREHKKEHLNGRANSQKVKGVGGAKAKRPS